MSYSALINPQTTNFTTWIDISGTNTFTPGSPVPTSIAGGFSLSLTMSQLATGTQLQIMGNGPFNFAGVAPLLTDTNATLSLDYTADSGTTETYNLPNILLVSLPGGTPSYFLSIPTTLISSLSTTPLTKLRINNVKITLKNNGQNRVFAPVLNNHILSFSNPEPIIYTFTTNINPSYPLNVNTIGTPYLFTIAFNFVFIDASQSELSQLYNLHGSTYSAPVLFLMSYCDPLNSFDLINSFNNDTTAGSTYLFTNVDNTVSTITPLSLPTSIYKINGSTIDGIPNFLITSDATSYPHLFNPAYPFFLTAASGTFSIRLPSSITVPISTNQLPGSGGGGGAGGAIIPFAQAVTSLDIVPNKTTEQFLTYTIPPSAQKLKQYYLISWNTAFPVQRPRSFKLEYTLGSVATFTLSYKQTITNPASFSALRLVFNILINGMKKTVTNKTVALQAGVFVSPAISIGNVLLNDILTIKLITLQGLQGTKWRTFASLFNKTYKFI